MDIGLLLLQAFWFIAPAYAANGFPPLMRGKIPLDRKKMFHGHRLLGDGKTLEGTFGGVIFGVFIGAIQLYGQSYLPQELGLAVMTLPIIFLLSIGTMVGDIGGSFVKRRLRFNRGDRALFLDQLGFLIMAFIFVSPFYLPSSVQMIILIILTPIIHWLANILGYWIKVKRNPW